MLEFVGDLALARDVPLREKTLWRMLYETAARVSEVLALNIVSPSLPFAVEGPPGGWLAEFRDLVMPYLLVMAMIDFWHPRAV